jgi:hypothetical protein
MDTYRSDEMSNFEKIKSRANYDLRNCNNDPDAIREQMVKGFWAFIDFSEKNSEKPEERPTKSQPSKSKFSNNFVNNKPSSSRLIKAPLRGLLDDGGKNRQPSKNFQACLMSTNFSENLTIDEKSKLLSKFYRAGSSRTDSRSKSSLVKPQYPRQSLSVSQMRAKSAFM